MRELITFERATRMIMHFSPEEGAAPRQIYYQVEIDPKNEISKDDTFSPSGDFVRFNTGRSEVHGWIPVEDICVDEILSEYHGMTEDEDGPYEDWRPVEAVSKAASG